MHNIYSIYIISDALGYETPCIIIIKIYITIHTRIIYNDEWIIKHVYR